MYGYRGEDIITTGQEGGRTVLRNNESVSGQGFELDALWRVRRALTLTGSYAWQRGEFDDGRRPPGVPEHQVNLAANWQFRPGWGLHAQALWIGERAQAPEGDRSKADDYWLTHLHLRRRDLLPGTDLTVSVTNLFDTEAYEVHPLGSLIDVPVPERQVRATLTVRC